MIALAQGNINEKARHRVGWLTPAERKKLKIKDKCSDCANLGVNHGPRCKHGNFPTKVAAVCTRFTERTAVDL